MSRVAFIFFSFFACFLLVLASPVPVQNGELVNIEKRTTHVGRVGWSYHILFIPFRAHFRLFFFRQGTWYYPGKTLRSRHTLISAHMSASGLGNCGVVNNSNDPILAIGKGLYDRNKGGNCGQARFPPRLSIFNLLTACSSYLVGRNCQHCERQESVWTDWGQLPILRWQWHW